MLVADSEIVLRARSRTDYSNILDDLDIRKNVSDRKRISSVLFTSCTYLRPQRSTIASEVFHTPDLRFSHSKIEMGRFSSEVMYLVVASGPTTLSISALALQALHNS